jgi:flagellar motor switch protein FliN/FliY
MMPTTNLDRLELFLSAFARQWEAALSSAHGKPAKVTAREEDVAAKEEPGVCLNLDFEGELTGKAAILVEQTVAASLTKSDGSELGASGSENSNTTEEILRQVVASAVRDVQTAGGEVRVQVTPGAADAVRTGKSILVEAIVEGRETPVQIQLRCSPELMASNLAKPGNSDKTDKMNLVMDLELDVELRFGERELTLRELLDLGVGSVVELDRKVEEPVDLILGGRVVAKGEVVIVGDCYGLRVTQVFSNLPAIGL